MLRIERQRHLAIWTLAWPMMLANVSTTLIGLVDTTILGHMEDAAFIGGVAVASSLFNVIYMSLAFLRMGTTGLIAQHFGEKTWQDLYNTFVLSVLLALALGCLLVLFNKSLLNFSLPLIGGSEQVQLLAREYADIRILSSPAVLFVYVALGFLVGIQKSRQALLVLMFSQTVNIVLDIYLAIYLGWNIRGVAWATVVAELCGASLALFFVLQFFKQQKIRWRLFANVRTKVLRIFNLNRDLFFRTIVLISIFAFITAQGARQGDVILAANAILIQIFFFLANAVDGFANAAESKTGAAIGAYKKGFLDNASASISMDFSAALQQALLFLLLALSALLVFALPLLSLISPIIDILNSGMLYLPWLALLLLCSLLCFVLDGVLIGATQGRAMLIAIVCSVTLVFFPCWYFTTSLGNHGLWLALCIFMAFRSALTYFLYRRLQKMQWQIAST